MNRSPYVGGGYRERVQRKRDRLAARAKSDREDAIAYAEPHMRDYEDAYLAVYGESVQLEYDRGYCTYSLHGARVKYRLQALIQVTAELQAQAHERVITNGEGEA
jgi:hypothetical protein